MGLREGVRRKRKCAALSSYLLRVWGTNLGVVSRRVRVRLARQPRFREQSFVRDGKPLPAIGSCI